MQETEQYHPTRLLSTIKTDIVVRHVAIPILSGFGIDGTDSIGLGRIDGD
jgi:hypothetical protein